MNNKEDKYFNLIFIGGMIDLALLAISILMWLWSIFGYSILSAEDRKASAELSSAAGTLFWCFIAYSFIFGLLVNILIPIENKKRNFKHTQNKHNNSNVFCEECGCPDVAIYDDGTCECNGCGFTWRE